MLKMAFMAWPKAILGAFSASLTSLPSVSSREVGTRNLGQIFKFPVSWEVYVGIPGNGFALVRILVVLISDVVDTNNYQTKTCDFVLDQDHKNEMRINSLSLTAIFL